MSKIFKDSQNKRKLILQLQHSLRAFFFLKPSVKVKYCLKTDWFLIKFLSFKENLGKTCCQNRSLVDCI